MTWQIFGEKQMDVFSVCIPWTTCSIMIIIINCIFIILINQVCNHQFVVEFLGIVPDRLAIVMRFMPNGSLQKLLYDRADGITDPSQLPSVYGSLAKEAILVRMALEAAHGLKHLHLEGVIHRDVAARNVLVDAHLHVRVADYGFARIQDVGSQKGACTKSTIGPFKWSAPEATRPPQW